MSRCKACNKVMNSFEMTRKYEDNEYVDMCTPCFKASGYTKPVKERADLRSLEEDDYSVCDEDYFRE